LKDPRIAAIIPSIHVEATEEMNALHPEKWASKVSVTTKTGETYAVFVEYPKGDPENTMTESEIADKYMSLATLKIDEEKARRILEKCRNIDKIDNLTGFFSEE
jgi:2-methylcitrate dehydratase PrpD